MSLIRSGPRRVDGLRPCSVRELMRRIPIICMLTSCCTEQAIAIASANDIRRVAGHNCLPRVNAHDCGHTLQEAAATSKYRTEISLSNLGNLCSFVGLAT